MVVAVGERVLAPCGSVSAYQRHLRRGEPVDEACRRAWRLYYRGWLERNGAARAERRSRSRAEQRALRRLARLRPGDYRRFLLEELAAESVSGEGRVSS